MVSFPFRWFCHFDDDMYVNIPKLTAALLNTGNASDDSVYFGRWPGEVVPKSLSRLYNGVKVAMTKATSSSLDRPNADHSSFSC